MSLGPGKLGIVFLLLLPVVLSASATEVAVLKNGFSIKHERRVVLGAITRLYVNADGSSYVDVPTEQISHFEAAPAEAASNTASGSMSQASTSSGADLNTFVNEASGKYRLDPDLVNSVIKAESGFNVRAVSPKGAQGLMQLMPSTASQLGVRNAFDPHANVDGGSRYLRELLERYNFDLIKALAAYNAGPQRVEQYGGVPPYFETRAYVARVVRDFNKKKTAQENAQRVATKKTSKTLLAAKVTAKSPAKTAWGRGATATAKRSDPSEASASVAGR